MLNVQRAVGGAVVLAVTVVAPSWAQQAVQLPGEMTTVEGVVESIDHTRRVLTVRDTDDNFTSINVPANAERFDEARSASTKSGSPTASRSGTTTTSPSAGSPRVKRRSTPRPRPLRRRREAGSAARWPASTR
jgi:hypothetical protein